MSVTPFLLLMAHSTVFFGSILSGIILGHSMATHRSLNGVAWTLFGTVFVVQIILAGIHAGRHLPAVSITRGRTKQPLATVSNYPNFPLELGETAGNASPIPLNLAS